MLIAASVPPAHEYALQLVVESPSRKPASHLHDEPTSVEFAGQVVAVPAQVYEKALPLGVE